MFHIQEYIQQNKCSLDLGTFAHNPLKVWLQVRSNELNYPEFTMKSYFFIVDWGRVHEFNCSFDRYPNLYLEMQHEEFVMKSDKMATKLDKTEFTKFDKTRNIDLRCLSWKITMSLGMEMLQYKGSF